MRIAQQRFQIPEAYFRPGMVADIEDGLQKVIANTLDVRVCSNRNVSPLSY